VGYIQCKGEDVSEYLIKEKRDWFEFYAKAGVNFSSVRIDLPTNDIGVFDFDKEKTFRFSVEAEYILPFNNNKWSLFLEPTYQYYKTEKGFKSTNPYSHSTYFLVIDYKSIEIPIGIRHKFFISNKTNFFINIANVFEVVMDSKIEFESGKKLDITPGNSFMAGIGISVMDRFTVEYRYIGGRFLTRNYGAYSTKYQSSSIILGYKIF